MLTILHTEASLGWGGQEIRILHESLGMIKRGYKVLVASPGESTISKKAKEAGINVSPVYFQKRNPTSILKMVSLLNREKFNIINTHSSSDSWVATIAAKISPNKPKIIRTRHLSTPISNSFLSRLIYDILPDALVTTGESIRERMINYNRFDASKIYLIPTGIDLKQFDPARVRRAFYTDCFSVGMVGVLRSWKGHRYFLEAIPIILKQIPDAYFYIVGDGPQRENITNLIKKLNLQEKVVLLGHREDIPEIMASLDVIVHPSYANEGVPQSILQAMAMEKPVVASDAGSIKEVVINKETGFLTKPKNPEQLAEKVIELYKHPEYKKEFGKKGRKLVGENYSLEDMLDKIESLYKKLLNH
ncbi:MAG: glycosyltransferase [Nitrospirota bacterium]